MTENKKIDWLRMIATALLVCAVMFGLFYLYSEPTADFIAELEADVNSNKETNYPNTIWLIEFVSMAAPILVIITAIGLMYIDKKQYVPVYTQIEKLVVSIVLALFVYVVLLAYVMYHSRGGDIVNPETEEVIKSLWNRTYMWFFAQILPLLLLVSYHAIRISSEKREVVESLANAGETEENNYSEDQQ